MFRTSALAAQLMHSSNTSDGQKDFWTELCRYDFTTEDAG